MPHFNFRGAGLSGASFLKVSFTLLAIFLSSFLHAQKVGINTDTPKAGLEVLSDDGILATGTFGLGFVQDSGYGTRLMWIPKKGAFRAGRLYDEAASLFEDYWDPSNIGDYSFAAGINNMASGYSSFSHGENNRATGNHSATLGGQQNYASGIGSFATGNSVNAPSAYEFSIGHFPTLYTPAGATTFESTDRIFNIGVGEDDANRKDAMTILKNGNVGINKSIPQSTLHIKGVTTIDSSRISFINTGNSVFIGEDAGKLDDLSDNRSVYIGKSAGAANVSGENNIAFGYHTLDEGHDSHWNIAIGRDVMGKPSMTGDVNIGIGHFALENQTIGTHNVAIGQNSLSHLTTGTHNLSIGIGSMQSLTNGFWNVGIGHDALMALTTGFGNTAVGYNAGYNNLGDNNVFVGRVAGYNATGYGNVMIGNAAGYDATGNNKLYIDNSLTNSPLILGDFSINKVIINDSLASKYFQMTNGAGLNKLLQSDATGRGRWVDPSAVFSDDWIASGNNISNTNISNVGIGITTPIEKLHVSGNLQVEGRIPVSNTGKSVMIGQDAGLSDDLSDNKSVYIGYEAGRSNVTGQTNIAIGTSALDEATNAFNIIAIGENVMGTSAMSGHTNIGIGHFSLENTTVGGNNIAIGQNSMRSTTEGNENVAIGSGAGNAITEGYANVAMGFNALNAVDAGKENVAIGYYTLQDNPGSNNTAIGALAGKFSQGSGNVFLGQQAGTNANVNNKLYIDNSPTSNPLVLGDFANNKLTINDSLTSKYFQMTNGAGTNKILQSNASGHGTWVQPSGIFSDSNGNLVLGLDAFDEATGSANNIAIGEDVLGSSSMAGQVNIGIGNFSLEANNTGSNNIAIGHEALRQNTTGGANIAIGSAAADEMITGFFNVAIGQGAMGSMIGGNNNVAIGWNALDDATGNSNVALGIQAGYGSSGSGNVFLGRQSGGFSQTSNKLYVDNTNTSSPLIYGDFDKNKLVINDSLTSKYFQMTNGAGANKILQSNAAGHGIWVEPSAVFSDDWSASGNNISNTNTANVGIGITTPLEKLHVSGNLRVEGRIPIHNTGNSVMIGYNAGVNDDLSDNRNVFVGNEAGQTNTTGDQNVAVGAGALRSSTTAENNVAIGRSALASLTTGSFNTGVGTFSGDIITTGFHNTSLGYESLGTISTTSFSTAIGSRALQLATGSRNTAMGIDAGASATGSHNVFLGPNAGQFATESNSLYIDNSNTNAPLLYGDFSNNKLTVNDTLTVTRGLAVRSSYATSTLDVNGSVAAEFKSGLVAGTTNPDATGMVWRYSSGTGSIDLPAASSCPNRMYVIINQTGTPRTISQYRDLTTTPQTSIASSVALWVMSDGVQWWQVK